MSEEWLLLLVSIDLMIDSLANRKTRKFDLII